MNDRFSLEKLTCGFNVLGTPVANLAESGLFLQIREANPCQTSHCLLRPTQVAGGCFAGSNSIQNQSKRIHHATQTPSLPPSSFTKHVKRRSAGTATAADLCPNGQKTRRNVFSSCFSQKPDRHNSPDFAIHRLILVGITRMLDQTS